MIIQRQFMPHRKGTSMNDIQNDAAENEKKAENENQSGENEAHPLKNPPEGDPAAKSGDAEEKQPSPKNSPSQDEIKRPDQDIAEARSVDGTEKEGEIPPKNSAVQEVPPAGLWSAIFNGCSKIAPLFLLLIIFCMSWHDFYKPDEAVYCPAEIKAITAFLHCIANASWLTPIGLENGVWNLPQWPGFYWFIGLLALIPGLGNSSMLLPVAELIAGFLAVLAAWFLAHTARFGGKAAFAAGLILVCCPMFAPLPHFMGAAALACGLLMIALIFFQKGLSHEHGFISLPLACIFTVLAGLTGGIAHFLIPVITVFCYIIWQNNFRRIHRLDALMGFVCMLVIIGVWLGWVMLSAGNEQYLPGLFAASCDFSWPPTPKWWLPLAAGLAGSMPWILIVFGVSWLHVLGGAVKTLSASRRNNGSALIWIAFALAIIASIWTPSFHPAAVLICALASVLLGKAFMHLPLMGNRFFFFLAALATTCAGILLLALHFEFSQNWLMENAGLDLPAMAREGLLAASGVSIIAAILIIGGIIGFYFAKKYQHGGGLIYACLLAIILSQPGRLLVVPELANDPNLPLLTYHEVVADVEKALKLPAASQPTPTEPQPATNMQPTQPDSDIAAPIQPGSTGDANEPGYTPPNGASIPGGDQRQEIITQEQIIPARPELNPRPEAPAMPESQAVPQTDAQQPVLQEKLPAPDVDAALMPDKLQRPQIIEEEIIVETPPLPEASTIPQPGSEPGPQTPSSPDAPASE